MPFVIQQPTDITNTDTIVIQPTAQMSNCVCIEVLNDTQYAANLILPGNIQTYMAPQTAKFFYSDMYYGDAIKIMPISVTVATFTNMPEKMTVLGYRKGENIPPDGTTIDLGKMAWIGNPTSSSMNELQNDNNPAGTPIIEVTTQGQTSSNQTATNDGIWSLGVIISSAIVKFLQSSNTDPILTLGALSHTVEVLGALTVDQNLTVKGTSSLDNGAITTNGSGTITASLNGNATTATTATTATNVGTGGTVNAASATLTGAGTALTVNNNATISGTATIGTNSVTNNETVGGTLTVTGDATFNGTGTGVSVAHNLAVTGSSSLDNGALTTDGSGDITGKSVTLTGATNKPKVYSDASSHINIDVPSGTAIYQLDNAGSITAMGSNAIGLGTGGTSRNILDGTSGGDTYMKGSASVQLQIPTGTSIGTFRSTGLSLSPTGEALSVPNGAVGIGGRTVSFNGNTSGNGIMYQILDGAGFKLTYIHLNAFANNGAANTDVALPVAYAEGAEFFVSNIGQIQAMAGGVAQTFQIITAIAAAGGTNTNQTTLNNYSWAHVGGTTIDTIRFSGSIAGTHSGAITIMGR